MNTTIALAVAIAAAAVMGATSPVSKAGSVKTALRTEPRPTITRAVDVVVDASPKQVNAGDDVVLTVRLGAERVRQEGFQVRLFTLPSLDSAPVEAAPPIDDCLIFFSTVYPVNGSDSPKIQLITNAAEAWLSLQSGSRQVGNGYYLLVFEKTGTRESVFRIKKADAATYFGTGMKLIVKADDRSQVQRVIASNVIRDASRAADASKLIKNDDNIPCYRYERFRTAALEAPEQLAAIACSQEPRA